jgi:hypothetical protein
MSHLRFIFVVIGLWLLQDESFNFGSGKERCIECQDVTVLEWLQNKIETVMILNMEDKPCPSEMWSSYLIAEENSSALHICASIVVTGIPWFMQR